MTHKLRF